MIKSYYLSEKELKSRNFKNVGKNCKISSLASFIGEENISIFDNVRIDDFSQFVAKDGYIKIEENTHVCSFVLLQGSVGIEIGKRCNISQGVRIYSKSDNYNSLKNTQILKKTIIHENVIIGSNSVILPGSIIKKNCRIGALTIVNKTIEENYLFYGKTLKKIL